MYCVCIVYTLSNFSCLCVYVYVRVSGVLSIRRIPIIGLGLGLGIGFGELKFGELKRNRVSCVASLFYAAIDFFSMNEVDYKCGSKAMRPAQNMAAPKCTERATLLL